MKLSDRLRQVADMVTPCGVVADVGTDHGYVPIYLIKHNLCKKAIAMDINEGPLERAKGNICREHLVDCIETRLSDGLSELRAGEADTVVIAGMGGELMVRILKDGIYVLNQVSELILSPHSELEMVRRYLIENNYSIADENMLIDEEKYYTIMKVSHGTEEPYSDMEFRYGRRLIHKKDHVLCEYLKQEKNKYNQIAQRLQENATDNAKSRLEEIRYQMYLAEQALKCIV